MKGVLRFPFPEGRRWRAAAAPPPPRGRHTGLPARGLGLAQRKWQDRESPRGSAVAWAAGPQQDLCAALQEDEQDGLQRGTHFRALSNALDRGGISAGSRTDFWASSSLQSHAGVGGGSSVTLLVPCESASCFAEVCLLHGGVRGLRPGPYQFSSPVLP